MLALVGAADGTGSVPGRRVAITGLGVVASCGTGKDAFWEGLLATPADGIRRVQDFDATPYFGSKEVRRIDRFGQLAVAAAEQAIADAGGLEGLAADPDRVGVFIGTGVGGLETLETQIWAYKEKGPRRVSPFMVPMIMANAGAAAVSMRYGMRGPCETTVTACASGTHSIANAARVIATGRADVMLAGGAEASCTGVAEAAFGNMTALSRSGRSKPFDTTRDGFVMAEGAAVVILEEWGRAVARGATIYAELAGGASNADAYHITAPSPGGPGAAACMEQAITDAGLVPTDIAHINAHGTSTPLNDAAEAEAIVKVFGTPGPPVTSTKGVIGHALGAAGAIETVASVLTITHRLIPPTAGLTDLDPDVHLDVVMGEPRPWEPGPTLSNSFGFGGHNGCLVISPT
ncbi:MAG: 3-oxoacyl-[acyl-carrier-protein] synthase [Acidimicrobiaceae bacterium]|jgi:3-oxoacyl-[acyl-carrier-protein] synthase II|nr:3-oxoacyl-[acyl-carrier-protein] synthase [Acidimicrobiaceae bacterium]